MTLDRANSDLLILTPSIFALESFSDLDLPIFSEPAKSMRLRTE